MTYDEYSTGLLNRLGAKREISMEWKVTQVTAALAVMVVFWRSPIREWRDHWDGRIVGRPGIGLFSDPFSRSSTGLALGRHLRCGFYAGMVRHRSPGEDSWVHDLLVLIGACP
jgi:hypothetical protein